MLTTTLSILLPFLLPNLAYAKSSLDCTKAGDVFCQSTCGTTMLKCTTASLAAEITFSSPSVICREDGNSTFLDYWYNCPTYQINIQDQPSCKWSNQLVCTPQCGRKAIKCISAGRGYEVTVENPKYVCDIVSRPSFLSLSDKCDPSATANSFNQSYYQVQPATDPSVNGPSYDTSYQADPAASPAAGTSPSSSPAAVTFEAKRSGSVPKADNSFFKACFAAGFAAALLQFLF
ncbi:hypothetical protein HDU97_006233 [Phlyctochytrium planicorne]|nr:hypothetical protein HDU97_006233 [Phlyctochytrium planicorne]